jgi:hypothetical protein
MVGAKGLGDEARQEKWTAKGHSCRRAQAYGHYAPHAEIDRKGFNWSKERLPRNEQSSKGSRSTAGKDVPAGTMAVVRSPIFCELSIRETALATLVHQRRLTPSCGGQGPIINGTISVAAWEHCDRVLNCAAIGGAGSAG